MNKKELKKKLVEIIEKEHVRSNKRRLETICRSQVNRLSYNMILGDHCIYLEKNDKKIYIESRCSDRGTGWSDVAYITAYKESKEILGKLEVWYEETIRNNRQAS